MDRKKAQKRKTMSQYSKVAPRYASGARFLFKHLCIFATSPIDIIFWFVSFSAPTEINSTGSTSSVKRRSCGKSSSGGHQTQSHEAQPGIGIKDDHWDPV